MVFITLLATIAICNIAHLMSMAIMGWFVGSSPESITLFYGPRIKQFTLDNVVFNIGSIPLGGSVKLKEFQFLHPTRQIIIAGFGCFVLIVMTMLVFGVSEGFQLFASGFSQLISGASSPHLQGSRYLLSLYDFVSNNSFAACLALVAAKMAAANMLPLPSINGGDIVLMLIGSFRPISQRMRKILGGLGALVAMVLLICWAAALFYAIVK